ncbi:MAG: serine hydrolase domain-containing protein [Lachnospiraceae bacterium]
MGCGHETEISDNSENWISTFLHHPVLHEPGTFYKYNTAGTNMLAAVLRRKTGQNVTEFLKPRLLEPLGITSLTCALLGDGTELGGGGMKMVTEDMAKFTYFLSRQGEWEGKQLLRKEWFERACHKQIETEGDSEGHVKDWAQGYGYQCWMGRYPGSFRADGAYGQFGVVFPDLDLIVILTSSTEQTQEELSALQEDLIPYVQKEAGELAPSPLAETVKEYTAQLALPPRRGTRNPFMEEKVSKHVYVSVPVLNDRLPDSAEVLIGGSGLFQLETSPIQEMRFAFGNDKMYWKVLEDGKEKEFVLSMRKNFAYSETDGHIYAGSAAWRTVNTLEMEIRRMDGLSGGRMIVRFQKENLLLEAEDTLISVGGLGISPRQALTVFGIKES